MLEPGTRHLLLDALRPPSGYALDYAVGTSFSLDLLAALTLPLAFTFFDWEDAAGRPTTDPLALLEAMRRYADRLCLFCQAGQIHVPSGTGHLLCTYLEPLIHEVMAPRDGGVFHPKVWALRYTAPDGPVRYRVLCASRNLTYDRSWDTVLAIDGAVVERANAYGQNHPLGDFFAALPGMALRPMPDTARTALDRVQYELRRVRFDLPAQFEQVAYWPLGLRGAQRWPFVGRMDRLLVISPFLAPGLMRRLTDASGGTTLVSRVDSLDALPAHVHGALRRTYTMSEYAEPEDGEADDEQGAETLTGLHAKCYIADAGRDARVWTGSANATDAAFSANVEFLIELTGKKSKCGIDTVLGQQRKETTFMHLLQEYTPPDVAAPVDATKQALERALKQARYAMARALLVADVTVDEAAGHYRIVVRGTAGRRPPLPAAVSVTIWPITWSERRAEPAIFGGDVVAAFGPLSFEALTGFFAVNVTATADQSSSTARFVLNLPLAGAPEDRHPRLLRALLHNRDQVLRYLLLLLAEGGAETPGVAAALQQLVTGDGQGSAILADLPLFECLVRAVDRDPAKLEQVVRLVKDLCEQPGGADLLPEGFLSVWAPIRAAYERSRT